jgi:uncharacterized protein (TIGR01777 family)
MTQGQLKRVVVAGGTGLVGRQLVAALLAEGARVTVLSRTPERAALPAGAEARPWTDLPGVLAGAEAVINLCGEGIADRRWSAERKRALLDSRLEPTLRLAAALGQLGPNPPALINASAVGIYGPGDGTLLDETRAAGPGFLADLCRQWEAAADSALAHGVRVVKLRIGIVLAREGGALPKLALPIKLFAGTRLGDGRQGFSWIHIQDLVQLFLEAARDPAYAGAVNATAPEPVSNAAFTRAVARRLHRPVLPVPAWVTRAAMGLLLGEMADEMLLRGPLVAPAKALGLGMTFRFPTVSAALADLL